MSEQTVNSPAQRLTLPRTATGLAIRAALAQGESSVSTGIDNFVPFSVQSGPPPSNRESSFLNSLYRTTLMNFDSNGQVVLNPSVRARLNNLTGLERFSGNDYINEITNGIINPYNSGFLAAGANRRISYPSSIPSSGNGSFQNPYTTVNPPAERSTEEGMIHAVNSKFNADTPTLITAEHNNTHYGGPVVIFAPGGLQGRPEYVHYTDPTSGQVRIGTLMTVGVGIGVRRQIILAQGLNGIVAIPGIRTEDGRSRYVLDGSVPPRQSWSIPRYEHTTHPQPVSNQPGMLGHGSTGLGLLGANPQFNQIP